MKYVITGSAGHISKPLALALLKGGHTVTVIGRDEANLKELTAAGAKAAIGSVEDIAFLTAAFAGADAVYTMVPPRFDITTGWKDYIGQIGKNYAAALAANNIKHVVNLSSVGAHLEEGCGPVSGLFKVEQAFRLLTNTHVLHLRPVYFYYNLLANAGLAKHMGIIGSNFGEPGQKIGLVDTADIAAVAIDALSNLSFTGHSHQYIASDIKEGQEIASIFGAAIGKPELPWVVFTDEQALGGMLQAGLTEEIAKNYLEMGVAIRTGKMYEDFFAHQPVLGPSKLESFAPVFAAVYNS